jgi:thioredoxin-like negative regulator of GroEL
MLSAVAFAAFGCESTQRQARQESLERWNQVRAQVKVKLASDQLSAGHVEDAANELARAARLDPDHPELLTLRARVCLARGDQHGAQRLLEGAAAQGVQRAEIDYLLGTIQQQRVQWDQAFNHFVRAANQDPREVAYVVAIARNMLQLGEAREALSLLRSHESEFGWTAAYHAAVAECHEQIGDWSASAAAWEKVTADSDVPALRERLALALHRAERRPEAIGHLRRLLEEAESHPATHLRLTLAQCLLETGQPREA